MSIGQLGIKDNVVVSTQINADQNLVKKYTDNFQILYNISKEYKGITQGNNKPEV